MAPSNIPIDQSTQINPTNQKVAYSRFIVIANVENDDISFLDHLMDFVGQEMRRCLPSENLRNKKKIHEHFDKVQLHMGDL